MLSLVVPANWEPERRWIADVVLGQFLGLEHALVFGQERTVRIAAGDTTLTLSDAFFSDRAEPDARPRYWNVATSGLDARLSAPGIPVLFGGPGFHVGEDGNAVLSLDVFGSAFYMLTRYEELVSADRDQHDRFPATASTAARLNFLDRPIVDEYVEILWAALHRLWPRLTRRRRTPRTLVSCDVDVPFDPACTSIARLGRRLIARSCRDRSWRAVKTSMGNYWTVRNGNAAGDPYWAALAWIMDVNDEAGNQVTFNFIPQATHSAMDIAPSVDDLRIRALLRTIHDRGHLVGVHPGYSTYRHPDTFARSVALLRRVLDEEGIGQDELGGRQHYLRWDVNTTARLWEENALTYDSTLSYPTVAGFRTGTCHEYTMYDLVARRALALLQRPLIVMENAVIDAPNMGLGHTVGAFATMQRYKRVCQRFAGDFTLLWHNSTFANEIDRTMYAELIQ